MEINFSRLLRGNSVYLIKRYFHVEYFITFCTHEVAVVVGKSIKVLRSASRLKPKNRSVVGKLSQISIDSCKAYIRELAP